MGVFDKKLDLYIAKSADFAIPILEHFREAVHRACPSCEEAMKWSMPHFMYKGSILCGMAAFKHHCSFWFRQADKMEDPENIFEKGKRTAMGHLGKIKAPEDVPSQRILIKYIREAVRLADLEKSKDVKSAGKTSKTVIVPQWFMKALMSDKDAISTFKKLTPGKQRDYIMWVTTAKRESTRLKRVSTSIQLLSEGKTLCWKEERAASVAVRS